MLPVRVSWIRNTNGPIAQAYHVTEWPTIYVIDHHGVIRYKGTGIRGARVKWLDKAVDKLIAEAEREQQERNGKK